MATIATHELEKIKSKLLYRADDPNSIDVSKKRLSLINGLIICGFLVKPTVYLYTIIFELVNVENKRLK